MNNLPSSPPGGPKKPHHSAPIVGLVGAFLRTKREALGLSQKALGQKLVPPVTTQFISNVERGVTPLPPTHIVALVQALKISEPELVQMMEREYHQRLSGRLGHASASSPEVLPPPVLEEWVKQLLETYGRLSHDGKETLKREIGFLLKKVS